jgi:hypothetical protein
MADINDLKRLLRTGAVKSGKILTEQELSEATQKLARLKKASKQDLEIIGESVAHDPGAFKASDIDDINTVLDTLGK